MSGVLSLTPTYYEALKRLTLELAGVNLGDNHAFLIETRLSSLSRDEGFDSLGSMVDELFKSGQSRLAIQVVSSLLERDTHFYTDRPSFNKLVDVVLPRLYPIHKGGNLKILSFGCSSGQEPYCIAMDLEKEDKLFPDVTFEVQGVDYPSAALDRARIGLYTHFDVQRGLPIKDLTQFFDREKEDWRVKEHIRDAVTFEETHLLSNMDKLGDFHVVLFRNALSHYSSPAQVRVLRSLSTLVKPLGYLILGTGETLNHINYGFDTLEGHSEIFRKREEKIPEVEPEGKKSNGRTTFHEPKK